MRLATFRLAGDAASRSRAGLVVGEDVVDLGGGAVELGLEPLPDTAAELIAQGVRAWAVARSLSERAADPAARDRLRASGAGFPMEEVQLLAPLGRPRKNVFCVGRNYKEHVAEGDRKRNVPHVLPTIPVFFTKAPSSIVGPRDPIRIDLSLTSQWDWEGELAVVIGRSTRNASPETAREAVFGYCCLNDVSARDLQYKYGQWFKGKSMDESSPMGPWIVSADEFGDPHGSRVITRVNGVVKQDAPTSDMIFSIDEILHHLSQGLTLEPGDIIATGTPSGVGFAREPSEFLHPGDVLETEIEGIGITRNLVVEA